MLTVTLFIIIILLFLIFFYRICVKPHSFWKTNGVLQGKSVWFFGENWKIMLKQESFGESIKRIYNKFPDVRYFGTYQFNNPVLVVRDPELIKLITIKDFENFVDHRLWIPEESDPLWTLNLFSLQGEKWKEMRNFLSPAFTGRKMRMMFTLMENQAVNFIKLLENKNEDLMELDVRDSFKRYACNVIATTAFGVEVHSLQNKNDEFYKMAIEASSFVGSRIMVFFASFFLPQWVLKFLKLKLFSRRVNDFFTNLVKDNIKTRESKSIFRPDMIHLMMEARKGRYEYDTGDEDDTGDAGFNSSKIVYANSMPRFRKLTITDAEIAAQAVVFILGGLDTVANILCFLAYELAINPDVQDKLRNEINEIVENSDNHGTYEDLQKMKYLDMIVTECLRKWPTGVFLERICTKPYTIPAQDPHEKDITIEKGTAVWIPTLGIHYDPKYYPNPENFYPERFSDENKRNLHPYTYQPFGEGPRNCIGNRYAILEAKVLFFHLIKSFEIIPVENTSIPVKIVKESLSLTGDSFYFGLRKLR